MTAVWSSGSSDAALLENSIGERRPQYRDYSLPTSGFLPRPPRTPQPQPAASE